MKCCIRENKIFKNFIQIFKFKNFIKNFFDVEILFENFKIETRFKKIICLKYHKNDYFSWNVIKKNN